MRLMGHDPSESVVGYGLAKGTCRTANFLLLSAVHRFCIWLKNSKLKGSNNIFERSAVQLTFSKNESRRYVLCVALLCEGADSAVFVSLRLHIQLRADLMANVLGSTGATKHLSSNG